MNQIEVQMISLEFLDLSGRYWLLPVSQSQQKSNTTFC